MNKKETTIVLKCNCGCSMFVVDKEEWENGVEIEKRQKFFWGPLKVCSLKPLLLTMITYLAVSRSIVLVAFCKPIQNMSSDTLFPTIINRK
jgi:hypothetical protein